MKTAAVWRVGVMALFVPQVRLCGENPHSVTYQIGVINYPLLTEGACHRALAGTGLHFNLCEG